jgi:ABC-type sugar transport system ATPase subunit
MSIKIQQVSKSYGDVLALQDCSLSVAHGELLTLLGPSGCGKSTLLRICAGFLKPDTGKVFFDDHEVNGLPVRERHVAFIMDNWGLYPHLDVFSNIAYPLKLRRVAKTEIRQRVVAVAHMLSIDHLLERQPKALSAGQRQRVAIARAVIRDDVKVLLADEPFSNLDAQLRYQMRAEFKELQKRQGLPCIFVTHDQEEALAIGDRIAVMNDGKIIQVGTAHELYHEPSNIFVAKFIGHPMMNLLPVQTEVDRIVFNGTELCRLDSFARTDIRHKNLILGVRPEALCLNENSSLLTGEVILIERTEPHMLVHLQVGNHRVIAKTPSREDLILGQRLGISINKNGQCLFDSASELRIGGTS